MGRPIWKGSISFGLVSIPVSLVPADKQQTLHLNMIDERDHAPIRFKRINANTQKEVPWNKIVKAYKYNQGQYVILSSEELKKANVKATQTIDIESFVPAEDIDIMYFERPYFLVPAKGGEKAYALLRESLKRLKKVAVATIVIRVKQHLVAVIPKDDILVLEILRFAHEVRTLKEVDMPELDRKPKAQELKMAESLIDAMSEEWKPEKYKDTYFDDVMKLVDYKVKHGESETYHEGEVAAAGKPTKVLDLMPLLRESLKAQGSASKRKTTTGKKTKRKRAA